jgi:hypothetical protein
LWLVKFRERGRVNKSRIVVLNKQKRNIKENKEGVVRREDCAW